MIKIAAGQDVIGKNAHPLLCSVVMDNQMLFCVYADHYLKEAKELGANLTNFNDKNLSIGFADVTSDTKAFPGRYQSNVKMLITQYHYEAAYTRDIHNHDTMVMGVAVMKELSQRYIVTTKENAIDDAHNFFLGKTDIPIAKAWVPYLLDRLKATKKMRRLSESAAYLTEGVDLYSIKYKDEIVFSALPDLEIPLWDKDGSRKFIPVSELEAFSIEVDDQTIRYLVSEGLRTKAIGYETNKNIPISLNLKEYDQYVNKYSKELENALDREVIPLHPTNTELNATAFKKSRLYMPQRSCVNAIARAKEANRKFVIATEEMGCGKTKQAIASVEEYFNSKWLREHPGKTLKDCFNSKEVAYRVIVTGPGHIVEKWKDEILAEVPDAKANVIRDVADFESIRQNGKKRNGKEFFIISKDAVKASTTISPTPQKVAKMVPKVMVCENCYRPKEEGASVKVVPKPSVKACSCPKCGGKKWIAIDFACMNGQEKEGLICPHCSNLLLKPTAAVLGGADDMDKVSQSVLTPADFATKKDENKVCYHCGELLWGNDAQVIGGGTRKTKWQKIKHFKNLQRKSTNNVWGFMQKGKPITDDNGEEIPTYPWVRYYLSKVDAPDMWYEEMAYKAGPRKASCSEFIKKHLKGYFDVCILDECHKFEGQGTAQSVAASALVKVSDFTIGLTGTISNGKADSFFWLLWMLMPRQMVKKGYTYNASGCNRFVEKYGSITKKFEDEAGSHYNKNGRGKQIGQGRVTPGISPLLFVDFLLENCVFLDMSDMSEKLPELNEEVVAVDMPDDVLCAYKKDIEKMKKAMQDGAGNTLGGTLLAHSLSYPDFPFNVEAIKNPIEESVVCEPEDFSEQYAGEMLPKEEKMVEIISREIGENRRVFVFGSFTRKNSPLQRWKAIIEEQCNLKGRVAVLETTTTTTDGREEWIHKQAKAGIQVIICNCKLVETGLDFCFEDAGTYYNYPSIIFMQTTYELSVLWQASHRHYRLNQREECRTYWMGYKGTLQMTALELMAEKIVAVSAIQGKFSSGALSAMAQGVDAQLKLAESLKRGAMASEEEVNSMFEKAKTTSNKIEEIDVPMQTYWEITGEEPETITNIVDFFDLLSEEEVTETVTEIKVEKKKTKAKVKAIDDFSLEEVDFESDFFEGISLFTDEEIREVEKEIASMKPKKNAKTVSGQMSLLDLLGFC